MDSKELSRESMLEERISQFYDFFTRYYYGPTLYIEFLLAHHFATIPICLLGDAGTGKTLLAELIYVLHDPEIARIFYFKAREDLDKFLASINLRKLQELGRVDLAIEFILPENLRLLVIDEWLRGTREALQALLQITEEKSFNYGVARIDWRNLSIVMTANPIEKSPDIIVPPEHLLNRINNVWIPTLGLNWQILWNPKKHEEIIEEAKAHATEIGRIDSSELERHSEAIRRVEIPRDLEVLLKTAVRAVTYCRFSATREASTLLERPCDKCGYKPICAKVQCSPSGWRLLRNSYHVAKALAYVRMKSTIDENDIKDALFATLLYKVRLNNELLSAYDDITAMIKFIDELLSDVRDSWEVLKDCYKASNYEDALNRYIEALTYSTNLPEELNKLLSEKPYMEDIVVYLKDTLYERARQLLYRAKALYYRGDIDGALRLFVKARIVLKQRLYPFEKDLEKYVLSIVSTGQHRGARYADISRELEYLYSMLRSGA